MHFLDTHCLTGKDDAQIYFLSTYADAATVSDDNCFVMEGILHVWQALVLSSGRRIHFSWALHAESFVWSFVIVFLDKIVKSCLLLEKIFAGRFLICEKRLLETRDVFEN